MTQFARLYLGSFFILIAATILLVLTAYSHHFKRLSPPLAILRQAGETLTIDSLGSDVFGFAGGKENNRAPIRMRTFLLRWSDNCTDGDDLGLLERQRYFRDQMQRDLVAIAGGDTLQSICFQQSPVYDLHLQVAAIAFAEPPGVHIDTLVYTGIEKFWKRQLMPIGRPY